MREAFLTELPDISCAGSRPLCATHSRTVRSDGNVDSSASNCIALTCAMPGMLTNSSNRSEQIVLSDECHCFAPKFVDTKLQGCNGALQILKNAAGSGSGALCRMKTVLILSALHRQTLDVADN